MISAVSEFDACGVITLTTDFGHKGPFVATMKGMMLSRFAAARIIDLTHETDVHFPAEAGFWLTHAFPYFPRGSVHVAVVDPGVGTQRDIVATVFDGHTFIAPDNGLLAPIANNAGSRSYKLDLAALKDTLSLGDISATFHGRDIFAPVGAELAAGHIAPSDLGPATSDLVPSWIEEPTTTSSRVSGMVVAVDNFGNLITNIGSGLLTDFDTPTVKAGGRQFELRRTYGDVVPGDYLALINSFGVLELARAEGSASDGLGLGRGAPVVVSRNDD